MHECSEEQWAEEMKRALANPGPVFQTGNLVMQLGSLLPCPDCNTIGFYSPRSEKRENDVERKYRACKFCGFWQELTGYVFRDKGGDPFHCVMVYCAPCGSANPAFAYNWKVPWDTQAKKCDICKGECQEVEWPETDPSHPYHQLKGIIEEVSKKHGIQRAQ